MSTESLKNPETPPVKKPYAAPRLRRLGSVRELTLGTTPGKGEVGGFRQGMNPKGGM